jgi:hypothetical protein
MSQPVYKDYEKLSDIFETHLRFQFDQKMVNFLMGECCQFLKGKRIDPKFFPHFILEFDIKSDDSYVGVMGANLLSNLWLINVFPPNPEKFIDNNVCIFDGKK